MGGRMMSKAYAQTLVALTVNIIATLSPYFKDPFTVGEDLVSRLISEADTTYLGLWETIDQRYLVISILGPDEVCLTFQSRFDPDDCWSFNVSAASSTLLQSGNITVT